MQKIRDDIIQLLELVTKKCILEMNDGHISII